MTQLTVPEHWRLLDLCCKAGGASMGYHRAGFEVVGVDIEPQRNYPFEFIQADMFEVLVEPRWREFVESFDAIHVSPLCKKHTQLARLWPEREWPDQITPLRPLLNATGKPWVMENVVGAPLENPIMLCGSMMDPPLDVFRHRLFEANWPLPPHHWPCRHKLYTPRFPKEHRSSKAGMARVVGVYGGGRYAGSDAVRRRAMRIDWMTRDELTQAIPPDYTEWLGGQLTTHLGKAPASHPIARSTR